jgi:cell division protein FtsI (penicillin-binding protein 3)
VIAEAGLEAAPLRQAAANRSSRISGRAGRRISLCAVVFLAAYCALAGRLAFVSLGERADGERPPVAAITNGVRAEITDRNGVTLASNLPMVALEVAAREVWSAEETAKALAEAVPTIDAGALAKKLAEGRYVEASGDLTPAQQQSVFALGLPGVRFAQRAKRFYPHEALAAHVIGHVEAGRGGVMGLERVLDERGSATALSASLDLRVQQVLEDEISKSVDEFGAEAAWGAVMNVETGEILALASLPDFDPNEPGAAPADARRNRATYDRYELGSAFKPLTAAAALEAGAATEASVYDARGSLRVADRTITDFHGENRMLTLAEVIKYSSNIGAARMAADLGTERQQAALKALGLFEALPIELAERRSTELPAHWGKVETATIAYGHGISVTPLHLLAAFSATVNGGKYVAPSFLKRDKPFEARVVFSKRTSAVMRRVLREVILGGTASKADVAGYFVIGKTATADKPSRGGYNRDARIASFVGAFPGYAPRYTIIVSLDNPKPTKTTFGYATAGWNAAPTCARIIERIAPVLGVMPVDQATADAAFHNGYATSRAAAAGGAL